MKINHILPLMQLDLAIDLIIIFLIFSAQRNTFVTLTIFLSNNASKLGRRLGIAATGIIATNNGLSLYDRIIGNTNTPRANSDNNKDKNKETKTEDTKDSSASDNKDKTNDTKKD